MPVVALRPDETWHRLLQWTYGQAPSERLAAQVLISEGYVSVDPSHPLGGPDGGKDAVCNKDGKKWVMAAYFPRGQQSFSAIKKKFIDDLDGVATNNAQGLVFVTNQELRLSERAELLGAAGATEVELYHLERTASVLDKPGMAGIRKQFLGIDSTTPYEAIPKFDGEIGHFGMSAGFVEFIYAHLRQVVEVDVYMDWDDFDGDPGSEGSFVRSWMVLWTRNYGPIPSGEKPSCFNSEGVEYNIDTDRDAPESCLMLYRGSARLKGYFSVVGCDGPHQGLMGVRLRPLRVEEALRTR